MPMLFSEADVEQMILDCLHANGWIYHKPEDIPRHHGNVLVEPWLKDALIRLNPEIAANPDRADDVIRALRTRLFVQPQDLITRNEEVRKFLLGENSFPFAEGGKATSVRFFDMENLGNNTYACTNQWVYPQVNGGKRLDVVLIINGIPVCVGEMKTNTHPAITWLDGAGDILAYEKSIPNMFVTNFFNFATDGRRYRYGSINAPLTAWGPWHVPENHQEGTMNDVKRSASAMLKPGIVLDIMRFFTVFSTDKKHRKFKVVCRYQQYEGANMIVERVLEGRVKKGLIWHFQGSGKSLLMVFAAQKLRMMPQLENPTVIIVDDRIDLESQMSATFTAADIPNLYNVTSSEDLMTQFRQDQRKIMVTTIFKFADVTKVLSERSNIILMVDEAHRTQEGDLGVRMRIGLPNAYFFGLTGTPINKVDKNTFHTFGAEEDRGGYMSLYSFADSVRDEATLPLHFEPVPVHLHVDQDTINEEFDQLTQEANLDEEEKAALAKRVKMEAIMKNPDRIRRVCEHIVEHYRTKVEPSGFKGQIVCYDRECCLLYKQELDRLLPEEASTIVIDTNNDKEDRYKKFRRDRDEEARVLDEYRDANHPLKLLIVTAKLLTGFDAPILQVMYLDKPMRDHTLLQAICRTNRVYNSPAARKTHGLIVDYIGIFDDVAKALNYDEGEVETIITNINTIREKLPELMQTCLQYFPGIDRTSDDWQALADAQECLREEEKKNTFGADYRVLNRAWEALSPDTILDQYSRDYRWLSQVYDTVKPVDPRIGLIWAALGPKTMSLVQENITVLPDDPDAEKPDTIELDAQLIESLMRRGEDPGKRVRKLEIDLIARIRQHAKDGKYDALGKRLEELREKHEQGLITSMEYLKMLLELARDVVAAERKVVPEDEVDKGKAALTELFQSIRDDKTPVIVERIVFDIDNVVKYVRFDGWKNSTDGKKEVKLAMKDILVRTYKIRDKGIIERAYGYVEQYY